MAQSVMWAYFTRISSTEVKCNICGKQLKLGGGTTNMKQHMKFKHSCYLKNETKPSVTTDTVPSVPSTSSCTESPQQKRKLISYTPTAKDLLNKAAHYLEMEDDECLILAKAYATKLRKLTPDQLMFADKIINDTLLDAQMGLLTKNSYIVHSVNSSSPETSTWSSHFINSSENC